MENPQPLVLLRELGDLRHGDGTNEPGRHLFIGHPAWVSESIDRGFSLRTIADLLPGRWLEVSFALSPLEHVAFFCALALATNPEGTSVAWDSGHSSKPSLQITPESASALRRASAGWLKMAEMGSYAELVDGIRNGVDSSLLRAFSSVESRSTACYFPVSFSNGKAIRPKDREIYRALPKSERSLVANPFSAPDYFKNAVLLGRRVHFLFVQVLCVQLFAIAARLPGIPKLVDRFDVLRRKLKNL